MYSYNTTQYYFDVQVATYNRVETVVNVYIAILTIPSLLLEGTIPQFYLTSYKMTAFTLHSLWDLPLRGVAT